MTQRVVPYESPFGTYVRPVIAQVTCDGVADDGAAINTAINLASAASFVFGSQEVIIPYSGTGTLNINTQIVMKSNVLLRPAVGIKLARGSSLTTGHLIVNQAVASGSGRDSNLGIVGPGRLFAIIDAGNNTSGFTYLGNQVEIAHCDGVVMKGFHAKSTVGEYWLHLTDVTNYLVDDIYYDTNKDGVHVCGPAQFGAITNQYGTTGDDMVGLNLSEGSFASGNPVAPNSGSITDLEVRNINGNGAAKLLNFYGVTGAGTLDRVTVDGLHGTTTLGVYGFQGDASLGTMSIGTVTISNVDAVPAANKIVGYIGATGAPIAADTIRLRNHTLNATITSAGSALSVPTGTSIGVLDCQGMGRSTLYTTLMGHLAITGTVTVLLYDKAVYGFNSTGGAAMINAPGQVGVAKLSNLTGLAGTNSFYINPGATTPHVVHFTNIDISSTNTSRLLDARSTGGTEVYLTNITAAVNFALLFANGGALTVRGCSGINNVNNKPGISRNVGTEVCRVVSPSFPVDAAILTPSAGDKLINTNVSSLYGGANATLEYDGTSFRALRGYLKQATAVLVAGTVTVADTNITANSIIRLAVQTPGGTVGAPFISARTAGTGFTITSTSNADTSTIEYEVVRY